jgi:hypothetical protein
MRGPRAGIDGIKDTASEPGVMKHLVHRGLATRGPRCVPGRFPLARGVLHGREPVEQDIPIIPSDHHRNGSSSQLMTLPSGDLGVVGDAGGGS